MAFPTEISSKLVQSFSLAKKVFSLEVSLSESQTGTLALSNRLTHSGVNKESDAQYALEIKWVTNLLTGD